MVKALLVLFILFNFSYALDIPASSDVKVSEDPLISKIKGFLSEETYNENAEFVDVIFEPKSAFYKNERVDVVKVVQTLKENGLLNLFFKKPQEIQLNFKTSGSPLFFVKIMSDTLRSIGYYRYVTVASNLDASEFTWNISLKSEYITDPLVLEQELLKSNCYVIDIERVSKKEWTYVVDMSKAKLNIAMLHADKKRILKRSLYAHWFNVEKIKNLQIQSSRSNHWYPYIAFYDASLHLLKVLKKDVIHYKIDLKVPPNARYMKISDLYTLKNVRDKLVLSPRDAR